MEQSLITSQRQRFLEELESEGVELWARADMENWFGSVQGRRLSALFLAQRLKSMRWEMDCLRNEPLRSFLTELCPGILDPIPAMVFAKAQSVRAFRLQAGEVFRDGAGGRWCVPRDSMNPALRTVLSVSSGRIEIEWNCPLGLPTLLNVPLYSVQGEPLWDLFACGFVMEGTWDNGDGPLLCTWHTFPYPNGQVIAINDQIIHHPPPTVTSRHHGYHQNSPQAPSYATSDHCLEGCSSHCSWLLVSVHLCQPSPL